MKRLAIVLALIIGPASAQQQQSPAEQAMGAKIVQELQAGLTCNISLITVKAELEEAKAKIKELEAKTNK